MATDVRRTFSLDGEWSYLKDEKNEGIKKEYFKSLPDKTGKMKVPSNWYLTEVGDYAGVIWFAREFEYDGNSGEKDVRIKFYAVDYIADVWLNGNFIGHHEGYFAPFTLKATPFIKRGKNVVTVRVNSPLDDCDYERREPSNWRKDWWEVSDDYRYISAHNLTQVKGSLLFFIHRPGNVTSFCQDGNTGGIWQSVEVIESDRVYVKKNKIVAHLVRNWAQDSEAGRAIYIKPLKNDDFDGTAILSLNIDIENTTDEIKRWTLVMEAVGKNFTSKEKIVKEKEVILYPGLNNIRMVHTVKEPELWWCWDHGKPNLYEMTLTLKEGKESRDTKVETFGIRDFYIDDEGKWWLNGKRVFARGMRYYSSQWCSQATDEFLAEEVKRMKALNINAVRQESHMEPCRFYELCDEEGLLNWQCMPFHWANWSNSDYLIEITAPMMTEMVELYHNCPSMVIYSTYKEPFVQLAEGDNLYGRLCEVLKEVGSSAEPMRWIHKGDYLEGVQNVMVWGAKNNMNEIKIKSQAVEFGSRGLAPVETIRKILPKEKQWPHDPDAWTYYNTNPAWFESMNIYPQDCDSLEELVEKVDVWYAREVKDNIELLRQKKFSPVCSMFQYFWADPWPCIYGSGVYDYYRRPYGCLESYKKSYLPLLVSFEWDKDPKFMGDLKRYSPGETLRGRIWIVNDTYQSYEGTLDWSVAGPSGKVVMKGSVKAQIGEDAAKSVVEMNEAVPSEEGLYRMEILYSGAKGELSSNFFEFEVRP